MREIEARQGVFRFSIEGKVTASMVDELEDAILPAIAAAREIEIDLSRVSEVDFAGLRLMVEAKLGAIEMNKRLCFSGHSQPVIEILELYGISGFLDAGPG